MAAALPSDDAPTSMRGGVSNHIVTRGVTFPSPDIHKEIHFSQEQSAFHFVRQHIFFNNSSYPGPGANHPSDIVITNRVTNNPTPGMAYKHENLTYTARTWVPAAHPKPMLYHVSHGPAVPLDAYGSTDLPEVFNMSVTAPSGRALAGAVCTYGRFDEQVIRQVVSHLYLNTEIYDMQSFIFCPLVCALIQRDRVLNGEPLLAGRVPNGNTYQNWGWANLGAGYINDGVARGYDFAAVGQNRSDAAAAIMHGQNSRAIALRVEDYTEEERHVINSWCQGGLLLNVQIQGGSSVFECVTTPKMNVLWLADTVPASSLPAHAYHQVAAGQHSSSWYIELAFKIANNYNQRGSLVRAFTRIAQLMTGTLCDNVMPAGSGVALRSSIASSSSSLPAGESARIWVNCFQETEMNMPGVAGSNFLVQYKGSQRAPKTAVLFEKEFSALAGFMGEPVKLWQGVATVGLIAGTGFSSALDSYNISGKQLGSNRCGQVAYSNQTRHCRQTISILFEADPGGVVPMIECGIAHAHLTTSARFNSLSFLRPLGWNSGSEHLPMRLVSPVYWNAWYGASTPYLAHPFALHHVLESYDATWGLSAPEYEVKDISKLVIRSALDDAAIRFSLDGRGQAASTGPLRCKLILEHRLLLNAIAGIFHWVNRPQGLRIGYDTYAGVGGLPSQTTGTIAPVMHPFQGGAGAFPNFTPGQIHSYNWESGEIRTPVLTMLALGRDNFTRVKTISSLLVLNSGIPLACENISFLELGTADIPIKRSSLTLADRMASLTLPGTRVASAPIMEDERPNP